MKKTTPQNLSKRLAHYGALSLAIAGVADVNGQIIYTDVDPDSAGTSAMNNVPINIDMDNDGFPEFDIRIQSTVHLGANPLLAGASILGNSSGGSNSNYNYPFALNSGDTISSLENTWINSTSQVMVYNNCLYTGTNYNQWCDVTDKYLGLRFDIGGNIHYGWARLNVGDLPNSWILNDYAYNSTPDEAITAGQQTLGITNNSLSEIKIVALNKSIALYNLPQQTNYRLFTINGQSILDGKINNNTHVIEANTLANGIYIIELMDKVSNAVMRKKIVL